MSPRVLRPARARPPRLLHRLPRAGALIPVALAIVVGSAILVGAPGGAMAADGPTLRVEPAEVTADGGETLAVDIVQDAAVVTTGTQIHLIFDPGLVEVVDFELGPAYGAAIFLFGNADDGSNATRETAIAKANRTGVLESVAGFLLPGSGTIAPGEHVFLTITLRARHGQGGRNPLSIQREVMLDEGGNELEVTTVAGSVTVGPSDEVPSEEPTAVPGASDSPGGGGAAGSLPPSVTVGPARVYAAPTTIELRAGMPARVFLVAATDAPASSIVADLVFDPQKIEITGIEPGGAWAAATLLAGAAGTSVEQAIAEANATGALRQAGVYLLPGSEGLPSGEGVFLYVLVKGRTDGRSDLALSGPAILDAGGGEMPVSSPEAEPGAGARGAGAADPTPIAILAVALLLVAGGVLVARSGIIPERLRRRWPYVLSLVLGLVPVALFGAIVVTLVANSLPVVNDPGLPALLGDRYTSKYSGENLGLHGLLPALAGTVLITLIAIGVALPVALALAIVAVDFPMGPLGRLVRPLVGLLSGVPPIVYATSVLVFITLVMVPKFAADATFSTFDPAAIGADPATWPPPDVPFAAGSYPWDLTGVSNSTLLGGLLVALLLIPFMTPLIADAMRDVSRSAREAALALGANRTYTLRTIILPLAMPGIAGAVALGTLKALGDTLIIAFAVGWSAETIPSPIVDALERTPSLAAVGAGLIGSFETLNDVCQPAECAVGYSSALLLLLFAGVVVLVMTYLQARGRRRVAI